MALRYTITHDVFTFLLFYKHHYMSMPEEFPAIQGGGSLILAWQIRNKNVLVVGGGEVSLTRPYPPESESSR